MPSGLRIERNLPVRSHAPKARRRSFWDISIMPPRLTTWREHLSNILQHVKPDFRSIVLGR